MCLSLLQYMPASHPTLYNTNLLFSFSQRSLEKKKSFFQTENSHTFGIDPEIEHTVPLKLSLFPLHSVQSAFQHTLAAPIMVNVSVLAKAATKGNFVSVYFFLVVLWFLNGDFSYLAPTDNWISYMCGCMDMHRGIETDLVPQLLGLNRILLCSHINIKSAHTSRVDIALVANVAASCDQTLH